MEILKILNWLKNNKNIAINAVLGLCVAFTVLYGVILRRQNIMLSESLEIAQNNIEAYQDAANGSQQASSVLKLDMAKLAQENDKLVQKIDSVRKENKIKAKDVHTAATQTQIIYVNDSKGVQGDIIEILKDTTYTDSIQYNPLTKIHYSIGKDSVWVGLDIKNTQYLYVYKKKEYKNKKNFFKRLVTLDFKKQMKYKYKIINTNDIIQEDSVRVIESI